MCKNYAQLLSDSKQEVTQLDRERTEKRKRDTVCVCVCVCGHVYVVYEDTNLYNDMGMT